MTNPMPNNTDALRYSLRHTKVTAYADGKPYVVNLSTVIQKDDIDEILALFDQELTRREAAARIDEYLNHFPHRKVGKTVWAVSESDIKERIAQLTKAAEGVEQ